MSGRIVCDAGPLIALARAGRLELLHELYGRAWIPPRILAELRLDENRPGAKALKVALDAGWLEIGQPKARDRPSSPTSLDPGEEEAICLAEETAARFLLIDEKRGRRVARQRGLPVVGVGGVLVAAKRRGLIASVAPVLDQLAEAGYHFSGELRAKILALAEEASPAL